MDKLFSIRRSGGTRHLPLIITKCVLIALFGVFLPSCGNKEAEAAADLSAIVYQLNKKCPQVIDSETRLDGLQFKAPNTLIYNYTLLNINIQLLDTHAFRLAMWPGLLSNIRVNEAMKKLRENNATLEYYYQDKDRKPVYRFVIRPEDYN